MNRTRLRILSSLDVVTLAVLVLLVSVGTMCGGHASRPAVLLLVLATGLALSAWLGGRIPRALIFHDFYPVLALPLIFNSLGPLIDCVNPHRWDHFFSAIDEMFFPGLAAAWRSVLGRPWWLTDGAFVFYLSYYVFPLVLAIWEYRRPGGGEFPVYAFRVVMCFYLSYTGYFLFPTVGPRPPVELQDQIVGGGVLSWAARTFLYYAEHTLTDAFPSGHTAVTIVCLLHGWRRIPRGRLLWATWSAGIVFSTVYLHYHYVADIAAGAALGIVSPLLADGLRQGLESLRQRTQAPGVS